QLVSGVNSVACGPSGARSSVDARDDVDVIPAVSAAEFDEPLVGTAGARGRRHVGREADFAALYCPDWRAWGCDDVSALVEAPPREWAVAIEQRLRCPHGRGDGPRQVAG